MDIESEIQSNRLHGVVVSSHYNRTHTSPRARTFSRLCPLGQPAIPMNGNHTASFNPLTQGGGRTVSYKV